MNYKPYTFRSDEENTSFFFQSVGKRGIFDKLILIRPVSEEHYNLALLDYDIDTQEYSDISVTDNGDMPEVLATVMKAILLFLDKYPERKVNFQGSTGSRTRLYQIAINKIYPDIKKDLTIYGWINSEWIAFEPNLSFESFLIGKRTITSRLLICFDMKTLEKKLIDQKSKFGEIIIDKSLNNFPTPPAALKKIEEAREFLKEHPIPKDLKW